MRAFRLSLIAFVAAPLLMGVAPQSSKFSPHLRFLDRVLTDIQNAKPGQPISVPDMFRGAVSNVPEPGVPAAPGQEPLIHMQIVHNGSVDGLIDAGFEIGTVTRRTALVSASHSRLAELAASPDVFRADPVLPLKPYLNVSIPEVNADEAHGSDAPPYPGNSKTGKGVVIGIVDTGVDYKHEDFDKAGGGTRITHIWDQTDDGSSPGPPSGYPCTGNREYCGNEWTSGQINNNSCRQTDDVGHGTHVLGCAVGDGSATGNGQPAYTYVGVAPEADIIAVNTVFLTSALTEGVEYIMDRAGSKPCVVNLSLGSQFGPHDGTSTLDLALADLSGPGRIIVAACGNEGDVPIHGERQVGAGQTRAFTLNVPVYNGFSGANALVWSDGWYDSNARLSVTVTSPNGHVVGPVGFGDLADIDTDDGTVLIDNQQTNSVTGDRELCIILYDAIPTERPEPGDWKFEVSTMTPVATELDMWMAFSNLFQGANPVSAKFTGGSLDVAEVISSPASSDKVIAVGAYTTRTSWIAQSGSPVSYTSPDIMVDRIAPFSSQGPLRNGALKPDIAAPGVGIGSVAASNLAFDPLTMLQDGKHRIDQGTSQATPHVTGTVALILQSNPNYDFDAVMTVLSETARADAFTAGPSGRGAALSPQALPNPIFGHGKLDAGAAAGYPVPVRLQNLTVSFESGLPAVRWTLAEHEAGSTFQVERASIKSGPFHPVSEILLGEGPFLWVDAEPAAAEPWYRIRHQLRSGVTGHFGPVRLEALANRIQLWQNAPNPFAASTVLAFTLDRPAPATLEILDIQGRRIRNLGADTFTAGRHEITWDGIGWNGKPVAGGVYFYRLSTPDAVQVRRLVYTP